MPVLDKLMQNGLFVAQCGIFNCTVKNFGKKCEKFDGNFYIKSKYATLFGG